MATVYGFLTFLALCVVSASAVAVKRESLADGSVTYKKFYVDSLIVSRYAVTTIMSVVRNDAESAKEIDFLVQLPENAFISNFTMFVNGRTFYGIAKEKEAASKEFENRASAGENVGLVESRGTEVFSVRTNTAAKSEATFLLQYEELIVRQRSKYLQVLNLNPGALVEDLKVEVRAVDEQGVVQEDASEFVTKERISANEVHFSYSPSVEEQQKDSAEYGLARDLTIEYDVVHENGSAGEFVLDDNCYFAQFFSPSGVNVLPVDLVFVIDVSGSMGGEKIEQTREALATIINQLRVVDRFTMITFSTDVKYWKETLVSVAEFRQQALQFAQNLRTEASTDFNAGLMAGISVLKSHGRSDYVPLLVILTDGQPTAGITNENTIVESATAAIRGTAISLNCLGFGFDLNFHLLERLAYENNGIVRRIYEGEDAAAQLEGFFEEISSPILRDIRVVIDPTSVKTISNTQFPLLFTSGEIVVAGQLVCDASDEEDIVVQVIGHGLNGSVTYESVIDTSTVGTSALYTPSPERLTAFLLIQQLLQTRITLTNATEIAAIEERALELSLKYNFVTELTSLIVVEDVARSDSNATLIGEGGNNGRESIYEDDIFFGKPSGTDYDGEDLFSRSTGERATIDVLLLTITMMIQIFVMCT